MNAHDKIRVAVYYMDVIIRKRASEGCEYLTYCYGELQCEIEKRIGFHNVDDDEYGGGHAEIE